MGYEIERAAERYNGKATYVVTQSDDKSFPVGTIILSPETYFNAVAPVGRPYLPGWRKILPGEKGCSSLSFYEGEEIKRKIQALYSEESHFTPLHTIILGILVTIGFLLIVIGLLWLLSGKSIDKVNKTKSSGYTRPWHLPEPKPAPRRKSSPALRTVSNIPKSRQTTHLTFDELWVDPSSLSDKELSQQRQRTMAIVGRSFCPDMSEMSDQQLGDMIAETDGMFGNLLGE